MAVNVSLNVAKQEYCNILHKRQRYKSDSDHVIRKRVPPHASWNSNDIYITNKSKFKAQLSRCEKLIDSGANEIVLHGLGAAIARTINLALQLQHKLCGTFQLDTHTSTVNIVDDLEPLNDQAEYESQTRQSSAVRIRVYRIALFGTNPDASSAKSS